MFRVVSVDTTHSVIFTYGLRPGASIPLSTAAESQQQVVKQSVSQRIDGVWWKHNAAVNGFVSLSNTSDQSIRAQLKVSGTDGTALGTYPVSLAPRATNIIDLLELHDASATAGSIELAYTGASDSILIGGGLEDLSIGYSATMAFRPYAPPTYDATPKTVTLTEIGLMTGAPDPMMLFPTATEFTPFSVLHNVSTKPVSLVPEVFWMDRGMTHRKLTSALTIGPAGTLVLNTQTVLREAGLSDYNGILNLTFKTSSPPNTLLMASGTVDQTGTYVFQVQPHEVRESIAKTISYWSTANGDDTMITVWNPADEPQDYRFTLHYVGGSYVIPLHLTARASRSFNVASIIRDQAPDADGHVIPASVNEGSARIAGVQADNQHILVDVDTGTYNVRKATCSYYCISCDGILIPVAVYQPVGFTTGSAYQMSLRGQENTGYIYELANQAGWTSSNTYVATISNTNSGGVTATGQATGVNHGTFTATGNVVSAPVYNSNYCAYNASCPSDQSVQASGPGTVTDNRPIITGINPSDWLSGANTPGVVFTGQYFGTNPPTLNFTPGGGISYALLNYSDTQIVANIGVATGTPTEDVTVNVTSNGYGGVGFQSGGGSVSSTSNSVNARVQALSSKPEITIIAWVDPSAPDLGQTNLTNLANLANSYLRTDLNSTGLVCASTVGTWAFFKYPVDIYSQSDRDYANTFLIAHSANTDPGPVIVNVTTQYNGGNYRLFNDWGGSTGSTNVGITPDPCKFLGKTVNGWLAPGTASQYMGSSGISGSGKAYQTAEGRIGDRGRAGSQTINNGRDVPWIWSVIEFDSLGNPTTSDHATFPTYSVYKNGQRTAVYPQATVTTFVSSAPLNEDAWSPIP